MASIQLQFEKNTACPLYLQLYEALVSQMMSGLIVQGDRIPSVRQMAQVTGLSKTTVENAYDKLVSEGYLITKAKSGYYCDIPTLKKQDYLNRDIVFSNQTSFKIRYDFSSRSMESGDFEGKVWRRYTRYILDQDQVIASYGDKQGEAALRSQLTGYLYRERGVITQPEQMVIGAGIQPLLYLFCSVFRDAHLKIGFLKPGFPQAQTVFEDCHHEIVIIDQLDHLNQYDIDILYFNPAKHPLKLNQRIELMNELRERDIYLIEDDHNGEMHYLSPPVNSLQSISYHERTFYLSSFSKLLLPAIRLACLCVPDDFQYQFQQRLGSYNQTASKIEQLVLALYIQDGHMERRIKKLKKRYILKSQKMRQAISKYFGQNDFSFMETNLCYDIMGNFSEQFYQQLAEAGLKVSHSDATRLRLYFGGIPEELIEEGVQEIYQIYNNCETY